HYIYLKIVKELVPASNRESFLFKDCIRDNSCFFLVCVRGARSGPEQAVSVGAGNGAGLVALRVPDAADL
ncbi:MAG: hypothetical protein AAF645_28310, partial [Myxococcota bacterium]